MVFHLSSSHPLFILKRYFASQDTLKMFILNLWQKLQKKITFKNMLKQLKVFKIDPVKCPEYKKLFTTI